MTKVLLTGASGFVGSNVLRYLLDETDWNFTILCSWRHMGNPFNILPNERVEVITHDLTAPIPDAGVTYDYILNLASESHVDRSIDDPVAFIQNNIALTLNTLEYARKHRPTHFIQFSTDEVYGATDHEEWDVLLPSNPYAASKAAQEMIAIAYWKTYQVPVIITNSNNIIGPNQHPEKFVPKVIERIKRGEVVQIHTSNGKPGRRYWNPVDNVGDALKYILENTRPVVYTNLPDELIDRPDRYNLSGGQELDNLKMAETIAQLLDRELKVELVDAETVRPGYDEFYAHTIGKLEMLGWTPKYTTIDGLRWIS